MISIEQLQKIAFDTVNDPQRQQIQPDKTFVENGIDSLDTMTLLLNIEEATGIKFTEKEVEGIKSLNDVMKIADERGQSL